MNLCLNCQIIWKHLYNQSSTTEKGTLYAARNYLHTHNVTVDPMKNINAAEHLLMQYTFFGLDGPESQPTKNTFQLDLHGDKQHYASTIMNKFVEEMALPSNIKLDIDSPVFTCNVCQKQYASRKNLRKHQRDKHPNVENRVATDSSSINDGVQNYSCAALAMGLLAMDLTDARKYGDGARVIRLFKFLLLHCKAAKKPKYSYHILRTLAQVKVFLSPRLSYELTWNRFVNTSGRQDGNVEVDRVVEHHNRVFQNNCSGLRGQLTQKSVDRISRSAQQIDQLLQHVDKEMAVKPKGISKHKVQRHDAVSLACELHKEDIFGFHPGRTHRHFQDFPVSVFKTLDAAELHYWIKSSVKKMYRQNQFRNR